MGRRFRTCTIPAGLVVALTVLAAPAALSAGKPKQVGGHKIRFQYLAVPDTLFVSSERQLNVCLVNHGSDGVLVYDGAGKRDEVLIAIPVGAADDDLTEEPLVFACSSPRPDWHCLGPYGWAQRAFLVLRPDGAVPVARGETLCFHVTALNVNAEVGRAELGVYQRIAWRRAMRPLNERMAVFKTDLQAVAHDDLSGVEPDQHHEKTTSFAELVDQATDAQIPDDITVGYAATAGSALTAVDADMVDGKHAHELIKGGSDLWVDATGDTMTGPLTLPGPPVEPLHAATKAYADEAGGGTADAQEALCDDLRRRWILPPSSMECGFKIVFVTSQVYSGNLGGLEGGDAKCQALASEAGLEGTFMAWLADSTGSPADRFTHSTRAYIRTDGATVAESWDVFVTTYPSGTLGAAISVDEWGNSVGKAQQPVWTGTTTKGVAIGEDCVNWTSADRSEVGLVGMTPETGFTWTKKRTEPCDSSLRLYCFQQ